MGNEGAGLVPLRLVCEARDDVLQGGLADNHFAAQLDKVVRDAAHYPVYGDAEAFFAQTYPTTGLKTLLTKVFGRLSGATGAAGESGVLRSTTSFGGGKTHGLTAVYHLAKGARPSTVADFVSPSLLPDGPVQVAALVGDGLDPSAGTQTNGHRTYTLWGEMAAQIGDGAFEAMRANDEQRTAPGTGTIKASFAGQPTVVIIDEIAKYVRALRSSGSEDVRRMSEALPVFLGNLLEVAADPTNRVSVVITLAATANAFGAETDEITELLDEEKHDTGAAAVTALNEIADVLTRSVQPSAVIQPAEDDEIGEILKKRLFASVDEQAAEAAARAYQRLYESLRSTGEQLAGGPEQPATYAALVAKSYPFHPELVRVLDKRLGNIVQFQRARGALKLLAEVVSTIYAQREDTAIINVGDIDYSSDPVLNHLTVGIGRPEYESVARGDFAGPSSHAASIDAEVFPSQQAITTRVARTVFTHSLELVATAGAGRNDWIIGTIRPGEDVNLFEKALAEAEKVFWHLGLDGSIRWRFHIEPNVNAIIETEKRNVPTSTVSELIRTAVTKAFANDGGATVIHFPESPADIPDQAQLRIAVPHWDFLTVTASRADQPPGVVRDMFDKVGSVGSPRKFRNSLVFAVADEDMIEPLKERTRAMAAADILFADSARMAQFTPEVRKRIDTYRGEAHLNARVAVTRCFKHIYYPSSDQTTGYLRQRELPPQAQGKADKSATNAVLTLLRDEGKIRTEPMSAGYLRSKTWPNKESVTTQEMYEFFWMDHSLSIVPNADLIKPAITGGIVNEGWVYSDTATGKAFTATSMLGLSVTISSTAEVMTTAEAQRRGLLIRRPTVQDLRAVMGEDRITGPQVRALLEPRVGGEPPKGDVLEVLANAVQAEDYRWIVVLDTAPAAGVRALTPSAIRDKGLDSLVVLTRHEADAIGIEVSARTVQSKAFSSSGAGGVAFQKVLDDVADSKLPYVTQLSFGVTADDGGDASSLDLAVNLLGMLQGFATFVQANIYADFADVTGGLKFTTDHTERKAFQTAYGHIKRALAGAFRIGGSVVLQFTFDPPKDALGADLQQIRDVVKGLGLTNTKVEMVATK